MTANELRQKYLDFFKSKGHKIIPSASLVPENDPSTLFTGSGMQPMVPYLLGEKHPLGKRITDSQKCFRAQDIEEVGDNRHTTFFEMLGNWSLGDYFKKEQISWMFEFLTKEIGLDPKNIYVTVFRGNDKLKISRDNEAVEIWKEEFKRVGIEAKDIDLSEKNGMQNGRIFYYDEKKNWWSRCGVPDNMPIGEPGGPDSEIFWDFGEGLKLHKNSPFKNESCHVNCDCGRFLEIGNNVFMQYVKTEKGFEMLPKGNIDFGGGLERILAAKNNNPDIFLTDIFKDTLKKIGEILEKEYEDNKKEFRVVADHMRAAIFMIADGIEPSNKDRGYFLRRLIRRAVTLVNLNNINLDVKKFKLIAKEIINIYKDTYKELEQDYIWEKLSNEIRKFRATIEKGLKEFERGVDPFILFTTYGFPIELTEELAKEKNIIINRKDFDEKLKQHQELSRTASAGMFKGGLADGGEKTKQLHTVAHLMLAGLRKVLGENVHQKGSNITEERIRFDFSHGEKMTDEQKKAVEDFVNSAISAKVPVEMKEMTLEEARESGAEGAFENKYGERVKVYTIGGDPETSSGLAPYSREICGGPHIENTGDIKGVFKIKKEESSSAGVRRIKAVIE